MDFFSTAPSLSCLFGVVSMRNRELLARGLVVRLPRAVEGVEGVGE